CDWMVPWTPGRLVAVAYSDGREVARAEQVTAGAPAQLSLAAEGDQYPIITVRQEDDRGVLNPYAENRIHYYVEGPARILSLESGNPVNTENNYGQTSRTAFFGLARCFLENTASSGNISVVAGAILGEKQLMTSKTVSIDVDLIKVRGDVGALDFDILYSTDGSTPTLQYEGPFKVTPNTTVKAIVSHNGHSLLTMSERFGSNQGIYWGSVEQMNASQANAGGDQAEDALFKGVRVVNGGKDYRGLGYLDFGSQQGGYVEWYQENDGTAGRFELQIRYSGNTHNRAGREMKLTVNGNSRKIFFPNARKYGEDWEILKLPIYLKAGANTIRITAIESGGMCIDEIQVK
ncbi:MAG: chitobiase/beta-hexosaminidase C-terminal domain-containing protein, partial [Lentimonas sp.]